MLSLGDRKNFAVVPQRAMRVIMNEIVAVVPEKAEGTPVPGAGFSPEAGPGKSQGREHQNPNVTDLSYLGAM